MASRLYDSFNRNPTTNLSPLGISDSGHTWVDWSGETGALGVYTNRARVGDSTANPAFATLDAGVGGGDGEITLIFTGEGSGLGAYFRVANLANWWRAYQRVYTYQFQSGTERYVSHYEQVVSHYEQVVSHYENVYVGDEQYYIGEEYSAFMTYRHTYAGNSGSAGQLVSAGTPGYQEPYNERKYNYVPSYSYPSPSQWGDIYISPNSVMRAYNWVADPVKQIFGTRARYEQRPVYVQQPVYTSQPVYAERPVYANTTGYELRIEKLVDSALFVVGGRQISGPFNRLTVRMRGDEIFATVPQLAQPIAVIDGTHKTATHHGIGRGNLTERTNVTDDLIDDFAFNPNAAGVIQPPVLL